MNYHLAQCQEPRSLKVRLFALFTNNRQKDVAKIPQMPGALRNVNLARAITWLVGVTISCTIFQ